MAMEHSAGYLSGDNISALLLQAAVEAPGMFDDERTSYSVYKPKENNFCRKAF